ncbi:hypothetical protein [Planococcus sp. NCCP-2050]|uniref:hypothetical protein n=1 Tax=Planococcus sp. NCCP-2050 TaxID=2944679 RepID=UPI00203C2F64|nr:hypothetical protein [Planococcus sp. NCCP-2050]GKW46457.1 hypothetical protein NCCP2050_21490 [Planococcus sp. NCCP-2050]
MDQSNALSTITYIDTERSIEAGEMKITQSEYSIYLFEDHLIASTTKFSLDNVWDISYKSFSEEANLLYLHTHRGVVTYKVFENPMKFVRTFKKIKNENY